MFDPKILRGARLLPWLAIGAGLMLAGTGEAQTWRTMNSARQVQSTEPVKVELRYAAGELKVAAAETPMLYSMDLRYDEENFSPLANFDAASNTLRLGVQGREGRRKSMNLKEGSRATIGLTREAPVSLDVEFGAGEADLQLGGISLRRLDVSTGASETTIRFDEPNPISAERVDIESGAAELKVFGLGNVRADKIFFQGGVGSTTLDFTGRWDRDAAASVKMGIGSVILRFPKGLAVRVNKNSFLTSFDGQGLIKRGDSYYSPDWDSAAHRLTVDVDAALGSIEVDWVG